MNVARMQEMVLLSSICRTGGLGEGQGRGGREEKGAPYSVSMLTFLNVNCILNERVYSSSLRQIHVETLSTL